MFKTSFNIHSSGSHSHLYKLIVLGNQAFCMCQGDLKKNPNKLKPTYSSLMSQLILKREIMRYHCTVFFDRASNLWFFIAISTGTVFKTQLIYHHCLSLQCYSSFKGMELGHRENCFSKIKHVTLQQNQKF